MDLTDRGDATPPERARWLREAAEDRPIDAARATGELLALVADHEGSTRADAGAALNEIGKHAPASLGSWSATLADLAGADDDGLATVGLRGLAQLAAVDPAAVEPAADAAVAGLDADDETARAAALSVLAELGDVDPSLVAPADGRIADALDDPAPTVCAAAVMAAGRLLDAAPSTLPRTRERLLAPIESEPDDGRRQAGRALVSVATSGTLDGGETDAGDVAGDIRGDG